MIRRRLAVTIAVLLFTLALVPWVYSLGSLSLSVSTDKSQYAQGETVRISGRVTDSQNNPVFGAGVSVQVGDPPAHAALVFSDNSGAYQDSFVVPTNFAVGQYIVYATASFAGYNSAQQQTHFDVTQQTMSTSTTSSQPSKCFIATATYGSEIAPEVALLRNFRDSAVEQTIAGRNFMLAFNAFYYSFSPQVAQLISAHETTRGAMKIFLYPLVGILYVSSRSFQLLSFNEELAVTVSGIIAALGLGAVYLGPIAIVGVRNRRLAKELHRSRLRWSIVATCIISGVAIMLGEIAQLSMLLGVATAAAVLGFMFLGAVAIHYSVSLVSGKEGRVLQMLYLRKRSGLSAWVSLSSPSSRHQEKLS